MAVLSSLTHNMLVILGPYKRRSILKLCAHAAFSHYRQAPILATVQQKGVSVEVLQCIVGDRAGGSSQMWRICSSVRTGVSFRGRFRE